MNREYIYEELKDYLDKKIIQIIEKSIYSFIQEYSEINEIPPQLLPSIYDDKRSEIIAEILNKDSKYLLNAIKNNNIDITKIAFMKPDELNPDKYEDIIKKKELENYKNKGSTAFKCKKCKKNNCTITEKQLRAADEPPTQIIKCNECGYTYKIN